MTKLERIQEMEKQLAELKKQVEEEKECEDYKKRLLIEQRIKDIALLLNDGRKIDWKDDAQRKYHIYYDNYNEEFRIDYLYSNQLECVFCLSDKFLETALEYIGEEDLKFYFGVDE